MNCSRFAITVLLCLGLSACGPRELQPDAAIDCDRCDDWNEPLKPFRIFGNTWYVGTDGLSSILIDTDDGLILIDGALPQSAALIEQNIRALGFDPLDLRYILVSHEHYDHAGGVNALQKLSDATVVFSPVGVPALRQGGPLPEDPQFGYGPENTSFPPISNVEALADGAQITLGEVVVTGHHTPGHSPGGMSWTWQSCALGECLSVAYADSLTSVSAPGFRYSAGMSQVLIESADRVSQLDCDILLTPHPFFFGLHDKLQKRDEGNPFVNNVACMIYAETMLGWLEQRLDAER